MRKTYTRTLNLLVAATFVIGSALVVTVDYAENNKPPQGYGSEPWEYVQVTGR